MADYFDAPNIPSHSVSLFSDAASKGIAAGNSLPTSTQSIISGIQQGIQAGQQYTINEQRIESNELSLEEARRQNERAEATEPVDMETAQIQAQNKKAAAEQQQMIMQQYQALAQIAQSGDMDAYAGAVLSGQFAPLFAAMPQLQKQAIDDTFPHWNENAQNRYLQLHKNKFRADELSEQEKKAQAEFDKSREAFEDEFSPYTDGDNAGFIERTEVRKKEDDSYKYEEIPQKDGTVKRVLKEKYDPSSNAYDEKANKPRYEIVDKETGQVIVDDPSENQLKRYYRYKNDFKLKNKEVPGQDGIGSLQERAEAQKKLKQDQKMTEQDEQAAINAARATPVPAPTPAVTPSPTPTANQDIVEEFRGRVNDQNARFVEMSKAKMLGNREAVVPPFARTPQYTPIPQNTPAVTAPTPTPEAISTPAQAVDHISKVVGGAKVDVSFNVDEAKMKPIYNVVNKINNLPGIKDKPAIFKGLIAVESAGNPRARSKAGAVGLTQLMPGAAADVGLTPEERYDPEKNLEGGYDYLERQYLNVEKSLMRELARQAMPMKVDPRFALYSLYNDGTIDRFALASYNGGFKAIQRGIAKGITSWDDMVEYLREVKSPEAFKENTEYVDKVLAASLPFVVGGNASDEDYIRTLNGFGIIGINT